MGIYIKGVSMPTDYPMWIIVHSDGTVEANEISQSRPVGWKTLRNAAITVPPHGDLIDRYDLKNKKITINYDEWDDTFQDGLLFVTDLIDNASPIIPAEE